MTATATPNRAWLDRQIGELRVQTGVALVGSDPEGVHQLRVAVRRIRAALKAANQRAEHAEDGALRAELRWFFGELGPLRDLDVLIARLREETADFTPAELTAFDRLLTGLRAEHGVAREQVTRALRGERY